MEMGSLRTIVLDEASIAFFSFTALAKFCCRDSNCISVAGAATVFGVSAVELRRLLVESSMVPGAEEEDFDGIDV